MTRRLTLLLTLAGCLLATTANAQFNRRDPATGEVYKVEFSYGWWRPDPTIVASSESLGIPGTLIDFETDLGVTKQRVREFRLVLRPARKHKLRIDYLPIDYKVEGHILNREIVFNGQSFNVGLPINVEAAFKTLKLSYEYDFYYRDRGYVGFVLDTKVTRARIDFASPLTSEFAEATAPIPAIGIAGRAYAARNVAVGGEATFFKLPTSENNDYSGKYYDYDFYATLNFNDNAGLTGGWRKLDLDYTVKTDFGQLNLTGLYFLGVVRF
jgi:hypothetical protein